MISPTTKKGLTFTHAKLIDARQWTRSRTPRSSSRVNGSQELPRRRSRVRTSGRISTSSTSRARPSCRG
jgi:hypothetical protein